MSFRRLKVKTVAALFWKQASENDHVSFDLNGSNAREKRRKTHFAVEPQLPSIRLARTAVATGAGADRLHPTSPIFPLWSVLRMEHEGKFLALNYTGEPELKIVWSNASQSIGQRPH